MDDKAALRRAMKSKLSEQSEIESAHASENIRAHLENLSLSPKNIAVYLAMPREPNLDELIRTLQVKGARVFAPTSDAEKPAFFFIAPDWSNIVINARGWREPLEYSGSASINASNFDLILLPGLAFDSSGARLGQGGGWYDRALENLPPGVLRVGVCFDFQVVETVPSEAHDQSVSIIVTDKRILHV